MTKIFILIGFGTLWIYSIYLFFKYLKPFIYERVPIVMFAWALFVFSITGFLLTSVKENHEIRDNKTHPELWLKNESRNEYYYQSFQSLALLENRPYSLHGPFFEPKVLYTENRNIFGQRVGKSVKAIHQ